MITDNVQLTLKAGDGGNGCVAFHREKYISHGGPSGGDGGNGGSIIVVVDNGANTLLSYKYRHKFTAGNGGDGKPEKFHGANAADLTLPVPPGTIIRDAESGKIIYDMSNGGPYIICRGGRGGWGNTHFATPTRQIPRFAKSGITGDEKTVILELKMLADVALIGLPNVGKSSLLAQISAARPKIADYEFTTLSPNLGVVQTGAEGEGFVAADIPGLIEGASDGTGLGHEFLRHVDRCRLLVHLVDVSPYTGRDPVEDIKLINNELKKHSEALASRPEIIVGNKLDTVEDISALDTLKQFCSDSGYELAFISAATGENVSGLVRLIADRLKLLPPVTVYESELTGDEDIIDKSDHSVTVRIEDGVYIVEGEWLLRVMGSVNFEDRESLRYFQRVLRKAGVIDALEAAGATDGDSVNIYDFEFDFIR